MNYLTIPVKGALAYTLRDLMLIEGGPVDWERISKMVNEMWPRMCTWMGLSPNTELNVSQRAYDADQFNQFVNSDTVMPCLWSVSEDGSHFVHEDWPEPADEPQEEEGATTVTIADYAAGWLKDHGCDPGAIDEDKKDEEGETR
jgi:hypothetical protein